MTREDYNVATDIITKIQVLDDDIYNIKWILSESDTTKWRMEIYSNRTSWHKEVNHKGLLPEFLNMALSELCKEREELKKKLEEL